MGYFGKRMGSNLTTPPDHQWIPISAGIDIKSM
jgi:hypothetical protein